MTDQIEETTTCPENGTCTDAGCPHHYASPKTADDTTLWVMADQPKYTGIKELKAIPMKRAEFMAYVGDGAMLSAEQNIDGYLVEYLDGGKSNHPGHAGYISWSPKDVFDNAYFRTSYSRDEFDEMSVSELAAALRGLKNRLEEITALKSKIQKAHDFLSIDVLPDRMDEEGIQTLKIKDVGRLQMSSDIRCAVPAANRDDVKDWLNNNGHGSMVSETINASTLKAFVREMMKENKEWPSHLLKVTPYSRATVVKA